jgi:GH24 family phage-related lysozyme (muramidase)
MLVKVELKQYMSDALRSLTYNLGSGTLERSKWLRMRNEGEFEDSAAQFVLSGHAGSVVSNGLLRRGRRDERCSSRHNRGT